MLTAQVESFADRLHELKPLLPLHWEELALDKDKVPLDPQYDTYIAREDHGEVLFVTLRDDMLMQYLKQQPTVLNSGTMANNYGGPVYGGYA